MKTYKRPVVSVDTGLAEGVYAASGATIKTASRKISTGRKNLYFFNCLLNGEQFPFQSP